MSDLHKLIEQYINRNDLELQREQAERRPGRPKSKNQEKLEQMKEHESAQYASSGIGQSRLPPSAMIY